MMRFLDIGVAACLSALSVVAEEVNAEKGAATAGIPVFGAKAKKGQWDAWSSAKSSTSILRTAN